MSEDGRRERGSVKIFVVQESDWIERGPHQSHHRGHQRSILKEQTQQEGFRSTPQACWQDLATLPVRPTSEPISASNFIGSAGLAMWL